MPEYLIRIKQKGVERTQPGYMLRVRAPTVDLAKGIAKTFLAKGEYLGKGKDDIQHG